MAHLQQQLEKKMTIDIVGIRDFRTKYPNASLKHFDDMSEYLRIAHCTLYIYLSKHHPNMVHRLLKSDDVISNIATAIMFADWRWDENYRSKNDTVRTKRSYRNQCAIWAIKAYIKRIIRNYNKPTCISIDELIDDNNDRTSLIPNNRELNPALSIANKDQQDSYCKLVDELLSNKILTTNEQKFIRLYYLNGYTYKQIGKMNDVSHEWARIIIHNGIKKLKKITFNMSLIK